MPTRCSPRRSSTFTPRSCCCCRWARSSPRCSACCSARRRSSCAATCAAEEKENSQLLAGELLRRLGRFEEARAHLAKLQGLKGFQKNFFADIVEFQLVRCASQDAAPYEIEDVRDFKRTLLEKLKLRVKKLLKYVTEAGDKEAEASSLKRKSFSPGAGHR